ncbi:hypothetical protein [Oricola thermophila]|uniref:Uncharacterized protein n=1 Tax=Oricola thermophila TaxID=2742145 RepID=A0A6N1VFT9_9HYPH|nr:hypothetical protein [Oricola thermophila]QKV19648.1 hypothetical protein HTY61_14895 [Oricola thermophila]
MTRKHKPRRRRRWFRDMTAADYILTVLGLCLGTAAALFPWHVYLNPDKYGPPRMTFSRGGVIPEAEILALQSGEAVFDMRKGRFVVDDRSVAGVDPLVTGRIDPDRAAATGDLDQEFPGRDVGFEVFAVDGRRALVGDAHGVYLIRPHSRLPDGTFARSFRHDEAGWYILTSDERILRP